LQKTHDLYVAKITIIFYCDSYVADLIHFGAMHYALECPTPLPTASSEQLELYNRVTRLRSLQKTQRVSLKGKTMKEAQKVFRVTSEDFHVETGTYLRVHVHPKRAPRSFNPSFP
jgi:hypothetical protein